MRATELEVGIVKNWARRHLEHAGFTKKPGKGSHTIFHRSDVEEIINLQPLGNKAKSYQVKHPNVPRVITVSGSEFDDDKRYRKRQIAQVIAKPRQKD